MDGRRGRNIEVVILGVWVPGIAQRQIHFQWASSVCRPRNLRGQNFSSLGRGNSASKCWGHRRLPEWSFSLVRWHIWANRGERLQSFGLCLKVHSGSARWCLPLGGWVEQGESLRSRSAVSNVAARDPGKDVFYSLFWLGVRREGGLYTKGCHSVYSRSRESSLFKWFAGTYFDSCKWGVSGKTSADIDKLLDRWFTWRLEKWKKSSQLEFMHNKMQILLRKTMPWNLKMCQFTIHRGGRSRKLKTTAFFLLLKIFWLPWWVSSKSDT